MLRGLGIICNTASANSRKDKSLRIMSQKFVMLFLVSKTKIVTLDIAAKILIEETQDTVDHSKFKSKLAVERQINQWVKEMGKFELTPVGKGKSRSGIVCWNIVRRLLGFFFFPITNASLWKKSLDWGIVSLRIISEFSFRMKRNSFCLNFFHILTLFPVPF